MISLIFCLLLFQLAYSQFPVDLDPNDISQPLIYQVEESNEFLLTLTASSNTNWSLQNSESATLVVAVDGDWQNYNQDIVLYAGNANHEYYVSLGYLSEGEHTIEFKFDYNKSSIGAESVYIESVDIVDIASVSNPTDIENDNIDPDVFLHSPILYGRDLLSWNESTYTDIPIIMFYSMNEYDNCFKEIEYHIIFSNEDSRVGLGLADLMFNYGRTTDIEWVYRVTLDCDGEIIDEQFQGASHTTLPFSGNKIDKHPVLKNATLNCNFTDSEISDYKFFLAPIIQNAFGTRQMVMDENSWSYRIMGEELINENRYENIPNPETLELSDIRNYIYIEYLATAFNPLSHTLDLAIKFHGDCNIYLHNHNSDFFQSYVSMFNTVPRSSRTSIELMNNFNVNDIEALGFILNIDENQTLLSVNVNILDILKLFYLDNNYIPTDIPIAFSPINITNDNREAWFVINSDVSNIDCFGQLNGDAECDDCGVCNGGNSDIDDCGVCFGNNVDLDCNGICFGPNQLDECGACDDNPLNDNLTCSGCTDENALNYDENAIFDNSSCTYSDNLFLVPSEYISIQNAIFFANHGDTIIVGPGIYLENIDFLEKSLVIQSTYDSNNPISNFVISGVDSISTVTINNSLESSLIGFTIEDGYGGGVSFEDFISLASDPSAFDSLITTVLRGGGLSIINSSPYIKDLHITNNTSRNVGAGIGLINSSATIESTVIDNNHIPDGDALGGGGIAINGGSPTLIDVQISNNSVGSNLYSLNGGGGILCGFSFGDTPLSLNMYNTTILNNSANIGAGFGALSGNIYMERTIIASNIGDYGSALSMGEPLGLVVGDINMNIINSTIANNSGLMTAGFINSSYLNILNSIFWNNNGQYEFGSMPNNDQLNINAAYSLFENEIEGSSNIYSTDPLFVDSQQNFNLNFNSPCIDAGTALYSFNNNDDIIILNYNGDSPDCGALEYIDDCSNGLGNLNDDHVIDISDIVVLVNIIMEFNFYDSHIECRADLNLDNIINIFDIIILVNIILNS